MLTHTKRPHRGHFVNLKWEKSVRPTWHSHLSNNYICSLGETMLKANLSERCLISMESEQGNLYTLYNFNILWHEAPLTGHNNLSNRDVPSSRADKPVSLIKLILDTICTRITNLCLPLFSLYMTLFFSIYLSGWSTLCLIGTFFLILLYLNKIVV